MTRPPESAGEMAEAPPPAQVHYFSAGERLEIEAATARVHEWFRGKVTRFLPREPGQEPLPPPPPPKPKKQRPNPPGVTTASRRYSYVAPGGRS